MKRIIFGLLLFLATSVVTAQTTEPKMLREISVYFDWNKTNLTTSAEAELSTLVAELRANSDAKIGIVGWTDNSGSEQANRSMSARRAQSVKAYFEQHGIATERITAGGSGVDSKATDNAKARRADITVTLYVAVEKPKPIEQPKPEPVEPQKPAEAPTDDFVVEVVAEELPALWSKFSLRTNLLYWVGGTLNIGVEWQPIRRLGVLVNGGYAPWASSSWKHNLGGWFVAPEVRYYVGQSARWFVGAQFLAGGYNVKLSETGYQGTMMAGGITGGYKLPLSQCLDMDFSLGLGYGQLKYDTYRHSDAGYNIFIERGVTKNTFMPIQVGVSLIWKIK